MPETQASTASLEQQVRRLKYGFAVCAIFSALLWVMGQQTAPKDDVNLIKSTGFVLVDAQARIRAALTTLDGEPRLEFYDTQGRGRVSLMLKDGNAQLDFFDAQGKTVVLLNSTVGPKASDPYLLLSNPGGGTATISASEKGSELQLGRGMQSRVVLGFGDQIASLAIKRQIWEAANHPIRESRRSAYRNLRHKGKRDLPGTIDSQQRHRGESGEFSRSSQR